MRGKMKLLYVITIIVFTVSACGTEKNALLPETDLESRNRAIDEVKKQLKSIQTASPKKALSMLEHDDFRVRRAAIKRLSALKATPERAVDALLDSLQDENENVRIEAAIALTMLRDERVVEPLIQALVDTNSKVRQWAYKALKKMGNKAVPTMIEQLALAGDTDKNEAPDTQIHEILMDTLSGMGRAAVPYLIKALEKNQSASAKETVALLGKIGKDAKESIYMLIEILNSDSSQELKKTTIIAIGSIGDVDPEVVPTLFEIAEGDNKTLAATAKNTLKKLEEES